MRIDILALAMLVEGLSCMGSCRAAGSPPSVSVPVAFMPVGEPTRPPAGYLQFCQTFRSDCVQGPQEARDIVLSAAAWRDLVTVNDTVNQTIKPMTDVENYGKEDWWTYPLDGYGDCEDYVLAKREMLIDAGWPRSALLITVVRDTHGDGHAILDVKTDRGEFILDNMQSAVLPWTQTPYQYVKRQTQTDQNAWVSLGDELPMDLVASHKK
jgi:predicted transglutaminase-like cysteine proteinase